MTEPKVSERMQTLITQAFMSTHCFECTCDGEKNPTIETRDRLTLVSAIAEIEQRAEKAEQERDLLLKEPENRLDGYRELGSQCAILAERADKWKEAAVAIHEAAMCARGIVLTKRVEAAFAALGDEWDEAGR